MDVIECSSNGKINEITLFKFLSILKQSEAHKSSHLGWCPRLNALVNWLQPVRTVAWVRGDLEKNYKASYDP